MKISLNWLNKYLCEPCELAQAQNILETQGFPVEDVQNIASNAGEPDFMLDVEVTSNRGDCLSHLGIAREVAAGRRGKGQYIKLPDCALPEIGPGSKKIEQLASVENHEPKLCSLYTARVITGVKIAKSPDWLIDCLGAVGVRTVNNVVDITNFVLMELGQPLHAFDLDKLLDKQIHIRRAVKGEDFNAIDGSQHKLNENMLVIADSQKPVAAAGVMGGKKSEVTNSTCDILLEAAIFDPVAARTTSRKLKLPSDSSYRFERRVDQAGTDLASKRAIKLILEIAGGELAQGVLRVGEDNPKPKTVSMRLEKCNSLLGEGVESNYKIELLSRLGLEPVLEKDKITCQVPTYRKDLTREVDLIEEVARLRGLDEIPVQDKIHIVAKAPQNEPIAKRILRDVLTAHGDCETVTLGFVPLENGKLFLDSNSEPVILDGDNHKAAPMLRSSILPSLLACRKDNQDRGNTEVQLYELANSWHKQHGAIKEQSQLCIVRDAENPEQALRDLRSSFQELIQRLGGGGSSGDGGGCGSNKLTVQENSDKQSKIFQVSAVIKLNDEPIGIYGLLDENILSHFGIQNKMVAAELDLPKLLELYPQKRAVGDLPRFPPIQRDLSLIVDEKVTWKNIEQTIVAVKPDLLESLTFLTIYRGKPIAKGKKSVSLRMRFRDHKTTLRHEQVDPQMASVTKTLSNKLGATLRDS